MRPIVLHFYSTNPATSDWMDGWKGLLVGDKTLEYYTFPCEKRQKVSPTTCKCYFITLHCKRVDKTNILLISHAHEEVWGTQGHLVDRVVSQKDELDSQSNLEIQVNPKILHLKCMNLAPKMGVNSLKVTWFNQRNQVSDLVPQPSNQNEWNGFSPYYTVLCSQVRAHGFYFTNDMVVFLNRDTGLQCILVNLTV